MPSPTKIMEQIMALGIKEGTYVGESKERLNINSVEDAVNYLTKKLTHRVAPVVNFLIKQEQGEGTHSAMKDFCLAIGKSYSSLPSVPFEILGNMMERLAIYDRKKQTIDIEKGQMTIKSTEDAVDYFINNYPGDITPVIEFLKNQNLRNDPAVAFCMAVGKRYGNSTAIPFMIIGDVMQKILAKK